MHPFNDDVLEQILNHLIDSNESITVRSIARLHPTIKHASSFIRHEGRSRLIAAYQEKQRSLRTWKKRTEKASTVNLAGALSSKDLRIEELEKQVQILTASHVAMIRVVGELGGMPKWLMLFEGYRELQETLTTIGAVPISQSLPHEVLPPAKGSSPKLVQVNKPNVEKT